MDFIKYYWGNKNDGFRVSVRTNCYNRSLAHIRKMIDELIKGHPSQDITDEDVAVVIYNTPSFKGIMGIEWNTKNPNKAYFRVEIAPCIF